MTKKSNLTVTDRTISNNNNYIITTNNNTYSLSPPTEVEQRLMGIDPFSSGPFVSNSGNTSGKSLVSVVGNPADQSNTISDDTIPEKWDFIKLDLFDNSTQEDLVKGKTKLKIALNIKLKGQTAWMSYNAQLNSPIRNMKSRLDQTAWDGDHYMAVRQSYAELKHLFQDVRASKFYEKGYCQRKGQTIEDLSVVVAQHDEINCYVVNLHFKEYQWCWMMRGGKGYLSETQRKNGIIATVSVKKGQKRKNIKAGDIL